MTVAPTKSLKMLLLMGDKPPDGIGRGYYTSQHQHATAISLPLLQRVHEEDLVLFLSTLSSTTSLLIVINWQPPPRWQPLKQNSSLLALYFILAPWYKVKILKLSVRSISTGRILPVGATRILPISWLQLLASFAPSNRSAQMRGLNPFAKLAAGSSIATSHYSTDGSTDLALESKQDLPYIDVYINITISHHYYFYYKLIQNPYYQPPPQGYHRYLQHGLGQHLQHDDRGAGFPSETQGLLKSLQSTILSTKIRQPIPPTLPSSKILPLPHVPESTAIHNDPSLILDEALVVLGQSWSPMKTNSHAIIYLV